MYSVNTIQPLTRYSTSFYYFCKIK